MNKIISLIAVCSALTVLGCQREAVKEPPKPKIKVEGVRISYAPDGPQPEGLAVATVEPHAAAVHRVTGRLVWDEDATVRVYSPVAGRVRETLGKLGDSVAAGAPLARIDSPDFGQAQADARKADADYLLAQRGLTRARELLALGAIAQKDLEVAENAAANAQSEKERAATHLALYGATGAETVDQLFTLKAPVGGLIVDRNLNIGQELRPDLMLANAPQLLAPQFVISNPERLWVLLDVTEMDMALLKPGRPIRIFSRALPDQVFEARLDVVGGSLDASTRTVKARGSLANPGLVLKAEMYVDAELESEHVAAGDVGISSSAVFSVNDRACVFVETAPGAFERREVRTGAEADGKILIHEGLKVGERVLIRGGLLLQAELESGGRS